MSSIVPAGNRNVLPKSNGKASDAKSRALTPDTLRLLVEQLVRMVANPEYLESQEADASVRGVILDMEMNGVRCILLRSDDRSFPKVSLSPREVEIAKMVAMGHPNKTIGMTLDISSWTVNTYLRRIFAKLGVGCRAAMVARLIEAGTIGGNYQMELLFGSKKPTCVAASTVGSQR